MVVAETTDNGATADSPEAVDAVVLGVGSGGETVAAGLARRGWRVAAVEERLLGGECPFLACIPSKALLVDAARARAAGLSGARLADAWAEALRHRRAATSDLADAAQERELTEAGVTVVRGRGRVTGEREVSVSLAGGETVLRWRRALVVGTGSRPLVPPIGGLPDAPTWTSDEALTSDELPQRLLVLGGGAVGCELAQVYAAFGSRVTLVESAPTLLPREDPWVGTTLAEHLRRTGVTVRTGTRLAAVRPDASNRASARLVPGDEDVAVDRVLLAAGRLPAGEDSGLAGLGVELTRGAVPIDEQCRVRLPGGDVLDDVFAVGDVTGCAPYTHTANHHARVVLDALAGRSTRTRHMGIPRGVYTHPPVLAVGLSEQAARQIGYDVAVAEQDVTETARAFVDGVVPGVRERLGPARLRLVADRATGRLLGAAAVAPEADSWAGELALAITAGLDVGQLAEHTRAFPSWSEAITPPALALARQLSTPARPAEE